MRLHLSRKQTFPDILKRWSDVRWYLQDPRFKQAYHVNCGHKFHAFLQQDEIASQDKFYAYMSLRPNLTKTQSLFFFSSSSLKVQWHPFKFLSNLSFKFYTDAGTHSSHKWKALSSINRWASLTPLCNVVGAPRSVMSLTQTLLYIMHTLTLELFFLSLFILLRGQFVAFLFFTAAEK